MSSADGRAWSEPTVLARMPKGHYQISVSDGKKVGVAFDYAPLGPGQDPATMSADQLAMRILSEQAEVVDVARVDRL